MARSIPLSPAPADLPPSSISTLIDSWEILSSDEDSVRGGLRDSDPQTPSPSIPSSSGPDSRVPRPPHDSPPRDPSSLGPSEFALALGDETLVTVSPDPPADSVETLTPSLAGGREAAPLPVEVLLKGSYAQTGTPRVGSRAPTPEGCFKALVDSFGTSSPSSPSRRRKNTARVSHSLVKLTLMCLLTFLTLGMVYKTPHMSSHFHERALRVLCWERLRVTEKPPHDTTFKEMYDFNARFVKQQAEVALLQCKAMAAVVQKESRLCVDTVGIVGQKWDHQLRARLRGIWTASPCQFEPLKTLVFTPKTLISASQTRLISLVDRVDLWFQGQAERLREMANAGRRDAPNFLRKELQGMRKLRWVKSFNLLYWRRGRKIYRDSRGGFFARDDRTAGIKVGFNRLVRQSQRALHGGLSSSLYKQWTDLGAWLGRIWGT